MCSRVFKRIVYEACDLLSARLFTNEPINAAINLTERRLESIEKANVAATGNPTHFGLVLAKDLFLKTKTTGSTLEDNDAACPLIIINGPNRIIHCW